MLGRRDRKLAMTNRQLLVLHNALRARLSNHQRPARSLDERDLLFVRHLRAHEAVTEFVQALASPSVTLRRWRSAVMTGGPVKEFHRLARDLGIADWIHFPGWIDTASGCCLRADADVLVFQPHVEGLVIKAMSRELAVITTPPSALTWNHSTITCQHSWYRPGTSEYAPWYCAP
jgi:glycosyltransferase involved in cell wall biosynthesis